jgi:HEAT repeat protein
MKTISIVVSVLILCTFFLCSAISTIEAADVPNSEILLCQLTDKDWKVRAKAAELLGKLNNPSVAMYLQKALKDSDYRVREEVAIALNKIQGRKSVPVLIKLLSSDPNPEVRLVIVNLFAKLGVDAMQATKVLIKTMIKSKRSELEYARLMFLKVLKINLNMINRLFLS